MNLHGAVIREQNVIFAVVIVKSHVISADSTANRTREALRSYFPGMPLVLAAQDSRGRFEYLGRPDLVKFLASISAGRIPWKEYTISCGW